MTSTRPVEHDGAAVDDTWGWMLALSPLLLLGIQAALLLLGVAGPSWTVTAAAFVVNAVLVLLDATVLRRRGLHVSVLLGLLLVPAYLFQRARAARRAQVLLAVWLGAFLASVVGLLLIDRADSVVEVDMAVVEQGIADSARTAFGGDHEVTCPEQTSYQAGERFTCDAASADGAVRFRVTVENADGDVTWLPVVGG